MTEVDFSVPERPDKPDIYPEVHATTLGRFVVAGLLAMESGDLNVADQKTEIAYRIDSSRRHLSGLGLDDEDSQLFDKICAESVPEALQAAKAAEAAGSSWQQWLAEIAGDDQLLEYLKWHVSSIEQQQSNPNIRSEIAVQKSRYKENLARGLEEGWLHPAAAEASGRTDGIDVYIGDVFSTALENTLGYCMRGSDEVIIAGATSIPTPGSYAGVRSTIRQIGQHEFNHAVLGRLGVRWLNEAVTEHIAQVLQYGDLEKVDPGKRFNYTPRRYEGERQLLDYLLREGHEAIPVELATLAYSEHHSDSREAFTEFKETFNRSWNHMTPDGDQALGQISMYIGSLENRYQVRGVKKAAERAMETVRHDLHYQPEAVFSGSTRNRTITMPVSSSS